MGQRNARDARTAEKLTFGSIIRIVLSTISPPLLTSATIRSALCWRYSAIAVRAHSVGAYLAD